MEVMEVKEELEEEGETEDPLQMDFDPDHSEVKFEPVDIAAEDQGDWPYGSESEDELEDGDDEEYQAMGETDDEEEEEDIKHPVRRSVRTRASSLQCCDLKFQTKWELDNHTAENHLSQCTKCDSWVKDLKRHIYRIHGRKRHKCKICCKAYNFPRELKVHVETAHNPGSVVRDVVKCSVCDKEVRRKGLGAHMERLHSKKQFFCIFCSFSADSRMQIVRHTDENHEKLSVECPVCSRDVFNLDKHMARHQGTRYGCSKCTFKTGLKMEVETHFRTDHLAEVDTLPENYFTLPQTCPVQIKMYKCDHCEYQSTNAGNVRKHIKTVHQSLKEKCDICGGMYKSAHAHKRSVHDKVRNFPCRYCDYKSLNNYQLNNHIRVKHTDIDERVQCDICSKKVKNLDRHIELNHNTDPSIREPKYFCDMCPYKTHDKSAYSAHIKAKHIRSRVACPVCQKMVIQCKLSGHMRCHKNNRFSCVPCARTFRERRDLGKHILYQHRHHRHKCDFCDRRDVTDFLAHVKYNHKEVDWKSIVVPTSDKIIISVLVKWLEEQFVYFGSDDVIEPKLKPVLELLKKNGQLTNADMEGLGYSLVAKESFHDNSENSNDNSERSAEIGNYNTKPSDKNLNYNKKLPDGNLITGAESSVLLEVLVKDEVQDPGDFNGV